MHCWDIFLENNPIKRWRSPRAGCSDSAHGDRLFDGSMYFIKNSACRGYMFFIAVMMKQSVDMIGCFVLICVHNVKHDEQEK